MKIHEYQAKEILKRYDVPVPVGFVTEEASEVKKLVKQLPTKVSVIKAQIHAGGRGKGGGVKVAKNLTEAEKYAKEILGMQLITHQTGPEGQKVKKILVEQGMNIAKEFYLGLTLDRSTSKVTVIASTEGGMEIEKVAEEQPDLICRTRIDVANGVTPGNIRKLAGALGFTDKAQTKKVFSFCTRSLQGVYGPGLLID